jgi:hypothetical protein
LITKHTILFEQLRYYLRILGLWWLFCIGIGWGVLAQKPNYSPLVCTVMNYDFMTKEGEVVTNVLSVKNVNGIARQFYLEIGCPNDWKVLTSSQRVYEIAPDDSIFIPIRLLPNLQTMKGSTKYNVSVFVVGTDGRTHAVCSFQVGKPKRVDWTMTVLPRSRIYFLNDQYETSLGINVANNGEEAQDVNLSWKVLGQGLTLQTENLKNSSFVDFSVDTDSDTTLTFNATLLKPQRNVRRVDLTDYRPTSLLDARKYTIYFRGAEPKNVKGRSSKSVTANVVKLNSAVDFIKLSNNFTVNSYGSSVIPLTWYSNVFNVLGIQPILMNVLNVNMPLQNNAYFRANLQHVFTFYTPGAYTLRNFNGMASYSSSKLSFNVGGGARLMIPMLQGTLANGGVGSGISASYRLNKNFLVASSGSLLPRLFATPITARSISAGAAYLSDDNNLELALGYARTQLTQIPTNTNDYMTGFSYRFLKRHRVNFRLGLSQVNQNVGLPGQSTIFNVNWMGGYSGSFLNNRLNQAFNAQNRQFINVFSGQINNTFFAQSRTMWQITKGFNTIFSVGFQQSTFTNGGVTFDQLNIPVALAFGIKKLERFITMPSLFYNYSETNLGILRFRGINLNKSFTDMDKNIRMSINLMGGYNRFSDTINHPELFTANTFFMIAWRTLSANVRYNYGPLGLIAVKNFHYNGARYPQYIFSNLNYQYVFKENRFVSEWSLNHSWNNQTFANNLNFGPQLYYFTKNRWRFDVRFFYGLNARNNDRAIEFYQFQGFNSIPEPEEKITLTSNFNLSFGIKKDFGIPLPEKFRKVKYVDANFVAFLDFNGNKVMDNDEVPLENIVIKVNGHEVLTDQDGKSKFVNIPVGTYEHRVVPLVDLDGWFTYSMDSIEIVGSQYYVPFTRGVKVAGSIVLDREKFTKDVLATLDLSGIKIFTIDTLGNTVATLTDYNGNFNFYVPYGNYILAMDEEVLGDRFYIAQNYIPMDLYEGMDGFYQSFFIIEKRRTVKKKKFNEKGELIMVEEVEDGMDRNTNKIEKTNPSDSAVIHKNNPFDIFKADPNNPTNTEANNPANNEELTDSEWAKELDARIARLDELIKMIMESKGTQKVDNKVLQDALRKLKSEEAALKNKGMINQPFANTMDPNKPYHLIAGSFANLSNAERFVKDLKAKGFANAVVIGVFNNLYLVRIVDYPTRGDAVKAQNTYAKTFPAAWVHKWP